MNLQDPDQHTQLLNYVLSLSIPFDRPRIPLDPVQVVEHKLCVPLLLALFTFISANLGSDVPRRRVVHGYRRSGCTCLNGSYLAGLSRSLVS